MRIRAAIRAAWCRIADHGDRQSIRVHHDQPNGVRVDELALEECLACPRVIRVRRSQVYAARARLSLDKQSGRKPEWWVERLAAVDVERVGRRGVM